MLPDLLALAAIQVLHCSGKGRSHGRPESRAGALRAKKAGLTVLLLVLFCSSSVLADTFGLGTAGPGNWGILETGGGSTVSMANNTGITVNSGASASQANLGINMASKLNQSGTVVVQGTYYKFSTNADTTTSGFKAVGGVNTTSTGVITTAAMQASAASTNLAALTPNQTLGR